MNYNALKGNEAIHWNVPEMSVDNLLQRCNPQAPFPERKNKLELFDEPLWW